MESNPTWIAVEPGRPKNSAANAKQKRQIRSAISKAQHAARRAKQDSTTYEISATKQLLDNNALSTFTDQTLLWGRLLYNPDLHAVSLFVVSTDVNLLGLQGRSGPDQPTALLFRGQALRCIQKVSRSPGLAYVGNGSSTFKMCLSILAAWEKVYGDEAVSNLHQKALSSIDDDSGEKTKVAKVNDDQIIKLMKMVSHTVRTRSGALADLISSDGHLKIAEHLDQMSTRPRDESASMTPAYTMFNHERPETRFLLFLLSRLADYDFLNVNAWAALHEMCLLIIDWRPKRHPPRSWKLLDNADDLEDLALYHTRAGMVAVLGSLTYAIGTATRDDGYFRASDAMDVHYTEMLSLETENLLGTHFEEAALWSIFIITAIATPRLRKPRSYNLIRTLLTCNRIESFEQLEDLLRKYAYREVIHRKLSLELYHAVNNRGPSHSSGGLRDLEISIAALVL